jgi:hypothetical protein
MRPLPEVFYDFDRACREYGKAFDEKHRSSKTPHDYERTLLNLRCIALRAINTFGAQLNYDQPAVKEAMQTLQTACTEGVFKCKARSANMGANDPQECNWPLCGCDPYADKVVAALQEHGWEPSVSRGIDGKFGIRGSKIVNLVSGEEIPLDEPLFLLRARDGHAVDTLFAYREICAPSCNELHLAGIDQVIEKFSRFAEEHPERIKQPGITRHLKLEKASGDASPWIPLSEKEPVVGRCVHLLINGIVQEMPARLELKGFAGEDGKEWRWLDEDADPMPFDISHSWQYLPSAPKGK